MTKKLPVSPFVIVSCYVMFTSKEFQGTFQALNWFGMRSVPHPATRPLCDAAFWANAGTRQFQCEGLRLPALSGLQHGIKNAWLISCLYHAYINGTLG